MTFTMSRRKSGCLLPRTIESANTTWQRPETIHDKRECSSAFPFGPDAASDSARGRPVGIAGASQHCRAGHCATSDRRVDDRTGLSLVAARQDAGLRAGGARTGGPNTSPETRCADRRAAFQLGVQTDPRGPGHTAEFDAGNRWRMGRDSNPRWTCAHAGFQDRCIQPLCHPSGRPGRACAGLVQPPNHPARVGPREQAGSRKARLP